MGLIEDDPVLEARVMLALLIGYVLDLNNKRDPRVRRMLQDFVVRCSSEFEVFEAEQR